MSLHANRVQMTVSSVDGLTGELTLGSATTGYQSFNAAYGANATVDILIVEGTDWEVDRNCLYDDSGGTVTRGTFEDSSSGSAVTFTSAAIVSVIATAATGNNWGLNEIQASPTGAGVTGVVGTMHILDISGLTADRDFTLPATCAVGDRVGVFLKVGDADHELLLKPASGDTINGGSTGAEWSRLFITGECVIFRCITADTDWIVEYDGRIPCHAQLQEDTATTVSHNALTKISLDAVTFDVGNIADATNGKLKVRRKNNYAVTGQFSLASIAVDTLVFGRMYLNGTGDVELQRTSNAYATVSMIVTGATQKSLNVGDELELYGYWLVSAGSGTKSTDVADIAKPRLAVVEVLK